MRLLLLLVNRYKYIILALLISFTAFFIFITTPRPIKVTMSDTTGKQGTIKLPLIEQSNSENGKYYFTGEIDTAIVSQHIVNITPDDCITELKINKTSVNLNKLIRGSNCDYTKGFDIDLAKYLKPGKNKFEIRMIDYGGWLGLTIKNSYYDKLYLTSITIVLIEIGTLLYLFLKNQLHLSNKIIILILLGILIRIIYLSYTTYGERTQDLMDSTGHFAYIRYVAQNLQLPNPDNSWEYHQAPLYYITAAVIYKIVSSMRLSYMNALQIVSLIYNTIFLIFAVLILKELCKKNITFFTATALLVFWPSGVIHGIRIGNDPLYYTLATITIYFLIRWTAKNKSKYFYAAVLFTALTILTKISGLILIGILLPLFLYKYFHEKNHKEYIKKAALLIIVIFLSLFLSLSHNLKAAKQDKQFNMLNGSSANNINRQLSVGNNIKNFLYFNEKLFITKAFISPWTDEAGRQYVWNYLLKTMISGEFKFPLPQQEVLANIFSITILEMLTFFFIGFFLIIKKLNPTGAILLLWFMLSIVSLIMYRHTYPFSANGDFRFIFPAIIPIIYIYFLGIDFFMKHKLKIIGTFGYVLCYIFILASWLFFLAPLLFHT